MNQYLTYKAKAFVEKHRVFKDNIPFLFMNVIKHFKASNIGEGYNSLIISKRLSKWLKWLDYVAEKYLQEAEKELGPAITAERLKDAYEAVLVYDFMKLGDSAEKRAIQYFQKLGYKEIKPHTVGLTMAKAETMGIDAILYKEETKDMMSITVKSSGFDSYKYNKEAKKSLLDRMVKYNIRYLVVINLQTKKGKLYSAKEFADKGNITIEKEN